MLEISILVVDIDSTLKNQPIQFDPRVLDGVSKAPITSYQAEY